LLTNVNKQYAIHVCILTWTDALLLLLSLCWDAAYIGPTADIERERNEEKHLKRTSHSISDFILSIFHENEILDDKSVPILLLEENGLCLGFPYQSF